MGVQIFKDKGCKRPYAIRDEYEMVKNHQIIKYIEQKYGTDNSIKQIDKLIEYSKLKTSLNNKNKSQYIPQYENEKIMLSIFTNI